MSRSCPLSFKRVDANIVRFISVLVTLTSILFLLSGKVVFALLLCVDFTLRFMKLHKFSPFFILANKTLQTFVVKPKLCDEAPKRFAVALGFGMSSVIAVLALLKMPLIAYILVSVLLICALFEALFDFCVGCKLYQLLTYIKKG